MAFLNNLPLFRNSTDLSEPGEWSTLHNMNVNVGRVMVTTANTPREKLYWERTFEPVDAIKKRENNQIINIC